MLHVIKLVRARFGGPPFKASPILLAVPLLGILGGLTVLALR